MKIFFLGDVYEDEQMTVTEHPKHPRVINLFLFVKKKSKISRLS